MTENNRKTRVRYRYFFWRTYLLFFAAISFILTCSFMLFLNNMKLNYGVENIKGSAAMTFFNVLFLSLIFCAIYGVFRKIAVQRPVKKILSATGRITQGDFSVRIEPENRHGWASEFDAIIEDVNKMAEELSGIETLRTDFIANVSHELKTPLAVIQNYATMLSAPDLTEEKRVEYAETVKSASRRLSDLITNILKLNKLENQQIFPEVVQYNLGEQLCECLLTFEDAWEKKNLDINTDIALDVMIKSDRELLTLVWNNLFSNAIKFTSDGGKISVVLKEQDGKAEVTVTDTGCGMTPEVGRHIFEKFYQGDVSHAAQGNGLGLALVKRVIDITGGEISVESTAGLGSAFKVTIGNK